LIIFKKVRWKNFLSTGNYFLEVQLDRSPTTLIVGENGSGKSTVLDALCFVLFNKPFRTISKSQLVNSINLGGTIVEIEFVIQKNNFKIIRGMKPNIFEIYCNGRMMNQDANALDTQKILEQQILKLNYRSFTQVVILGSSTFIPFMQLRSKDRREVVEDILDIKIFSLMNFLLKHKVKEVSEELKSIEYEFRLSKEKIDLQNKYIEDIRKNKERIIEEKEHLVFDSERVVLSEQEKADKIKLEIKSLEPETSQKENVKSSIREYHKMEAKLSNRVDENKRQKEFFENNETCPVCTQDIELELKKQKIEEKSKRIQELNSGIDKLKIELNDKEQLLKGIEMLSKQIREKEVEVAKIGTSITHMERLIRQTNIQIQAMKKGEVSEEDKVKLTRLSERCKLQEEQITKLREDKFYVDVARNLLMDTGIKTKIINKYLPIMNKLINGYLTSMDFYVNFTLDNNFNETIKSRHRDEFSYSSFSEGEKMRIDLALLFTWRAVAKMKNSTNTNLLILDEIFDSSLDTTGTDDFLKILHTFADQNVFVISHKGDTMFDKFRSVIKFEKQRNFSKLL
jgi:DNA repair exonuclease SbcCD ATPase subunit